MSTTDTTDTTAPAGDAELDGPAADDAVVMTVSDDAMATVLGIRDQEDDPQNLALRVEITGSRGAEFAYDLSFEELTAAADDDLVYAVGDLKVMVPAATVDRLRGAELDLPRASAQGGLVIRNPNRPDPLAGIDVELTGELPDKVSQLLEQAVNPALASHGGYATLVGVDEDNNVYVTMGGGCQGCAASAATLREGIQRSIKDAIPEVAEVIDATDHDAGENPFYT
ncbi:NifU family protein [Dermatobacter hominis]|uniref:NifU family protein n=1 Tax=Dermatobacter hominis TaxID=2884263 RepID=UPI001D12236A|nr:NifU family protein [Dermatobacter hominis]UDY34848.1 NifU family protein [Dermatobacter hominis]